VTGEFSTGIRQAERAERVLLVDDNPDNLQVLYQTLEGRDYRLLIAKSGEDALGIAHRARPALILLDIMMPGMDGYEVCRRLKAEPTTSDTPIIFLSALGDTASKLKGFELGAVDYITKPFQAEEVIVRVGTHLKIHRLEQRLSERNRILEVENQRILAAMGEGLYGLDCRGCITFANPAAARLTGWEESTLLGRDFHALHLHARADGQAYPPDQGPVHTTLGRGEVLHRDRDVFWRRDGSSFPVEYTCAPLREAGGVSGAVLVFKDISERRRAERRLQRIHEALVRSHREGRRGARGEKPPGHHPAGAGLSVPGGLGAGARRRGAEGHGGCGAPRRHRGQGPARLLQGGACRDADPGPEPRDPCLPGPGEA
jgi:PAS domain S-box-containing protein